MERTFCRAAVAIAAAIAIILTARAFAGPFPLGFIQVRSPLGLETVFTVIAGATLLWSSIRTRGFSEPVSEPSGTANPNLIWAVLALIALAYLPNLADPFISDDYILAVRASLDPARLAHNFVMPGGDGAFRPLGYIWYGAVHSFAGANPVPWHACMLSVHLVNCLLIFAVVSALFRNTTVSLVATLCFGLHGTRPEVVAWASDNFDLLACALTLSAAWCLFAKIRPSAWSAAPALGLLAAAILCKESAYAAPVLILAFAIAAGRLREKSVRVFLIGSVVVCVALFAYRWSLFHGPGGYRDPATGRPAILSLHAFPTLKALGLRIWTILMFPINWIEPGGLLLACGVAVLCASVLLVLWNSRGVRPIITLALLGGTLLAFVPAVHLAAVGESALGSRIFYLPAVPFFVLVGHAVASMRQPRSALIAAVALAFGSVLILEHNLSFWHNAALAADVACTAAARGQADAVKTPALPGILSFGNGLKECIDLKRQH